MAFPSPDIAALVLAGGRARRMGGADKAFLPLARRPLVAHLLEALAAPGRPCAISANGDATRFVRFGVPVLPDQDDTRPGPLAGVQAGLIWAKTLGARALITAPVDCPLLPDDLAARLIAASGFERLAHARAGGRDHPTVALWPVGLLDTLSLYLESGERRMMGFLALNNAVAVEWTAPDLFANLNTPEDLAWAEALLAQPPKT